MTISKISAGSKNSPGFPSTHATTKETTAAAIRIRIIASLNWSKKRCRFVFFFFFGENVCAVPAKAFFRLGCAQPLRRINLKRFEDVRRLR